MRAAISPLRQTHHNSEPLRGLANRVLGSRLASGVDFDLFASPENVERFEIKGTAGGVRIRSATVSAATKALGSYLRRRLGCQYPWAGGHAPLPEVLPTWTGTENGTAWARVRYFLNYCCFSYSLAFWDWEQWEQLIDWMALQGVNMPLAITGQEAVWQRVCRRLGLADEDIRGFLPGPAFLPFGWMGCLDGWSVPLSQDWINRHEALGQRILERERSLGMTPVLQAFTGHVPRQLIEKFPGTRHHVIRWHDWQTVVLDPMDPLFSEIAGLFLEEQARSFGTDHYYAADTFIEMTPPSSAPDYLASLARAIQGGMLARDPEAVWVLQGWAFSNQREFWGQPQLDAFLGAVPDDRILVLDLFCDRGPEWKNTQAFSGKPWAWCNVQNFGGNIYLAGSMQSNNDGLEEARGSFAGAGLAGIGVVNEALCVNPIAYDFFFDLAWRSGPVDLRSWVSEYAFQRYRSVDDNARAAWVLLLECVYSRHATFMEDSPVTRWPTCPVIPPPREHEGKLHRAWKLFLDSADALGHLDPFCFDLVNIGRQVLSDAATRHKEGIQKAVAAGDLATLESHAEALFELLADLDRLLATREEFLLGRWIADARKWGSTQGEADRIEEEARRLITVWGKSRTLRDYARREWSGLLGDFHLARWRKAVAWSVDALRAGSRVDSERLEERLWEWEISWCKDRKAFPCVSTRDCIALSRELYARHGAPRTEGGKEK